MARDPSRATTVGTLLLAEAAIAQVIEGVRRLDQVDDVARSLAPVFHDDV